MDANSLDFAYKYPFSEAAKKIVAMQPAAIDPMYIERAGRHIDAAMGGGLGYLDAPISYIKLDYVMTYLYARMLLGAIGDRRMISEYAAAEGRRSAQALGAADKNEMAAVAAELGLNVSPVGRDSSGPDEFAIGFADYIAHAPRRPEYALVNQGLNSGKVVMTAVRMIGFIENAAASAISKGMLAKGAEFPKEIIAYAKEMKARSAAMVAKPGGLGRAGAGRASEWIERLLKTPIPDVRHRTVNLILAPYLVNVKKASDDDAVKIIAEYIERCKEIEPNTKVNERYIRYQCEYARKKGLRPLSFERAKELVGDYL